MCKIFLCLLEQSDWDTLVFGIISFRVKIYSGYCPVGCMSGRVIIYRASVRGLLSGWTTVFWVSVHQATVCCRSALRKVFVGRVSGQATVRILLLYGWKPLTVSYHLVIFGFYWSNGMGDITYLAYHVV